MQGKHKKQSGGAGQYGDVHIRFSPSDKEFEFSEELFGGSVLAENVFSYPGLGSAAAAAGLGGDVPLLLGITLFSALFVCAGNLIANLLYGVVDPRIREVEA